MRLKTSFEGSPGKEAAKTTIAHITLIDKITNTIVKKSQLHFREAEV